MKLNKQQLESKIVALKESISLAMGTIEQYEGRLINSSRRIGKYKAFLLDDNNSPSDIERYADRIFKGYQRILESKSVLEENRNFVIEKTTELAELEMILDLCY